MHQEHASSRFYPLEDLLRHHQHQARDEYVLENQNIIYVVSTAPTMKMRPRQEERLRREVEKRG
jgi:hypothetical protein